MEYARVPSSGSLWHQKKTWKIVEILIFFVLLLTILIIFVYPLIRKKQPTPPTLADLNVPIVPTPTPIPFSHEGKMEFTIATTGTVAGPKFKECVVDPLNPHSAKDQQFSIIIKSENPIVSAIATWITDHGSHSVPLSHISGSETDGVWMGTWRVDDTAWYTYQIVVRASDGVYTRETALTLR